MTRILLICLLLTLSTVPAFAAAAVTVRASAHGDHARLVFDWPAATTYKIEQQKGALIVTFGSPGALSPLTGGDPRIGGVKAISSGGQNLGAEIAVPADATYQAFTVGNRIIIDVTGSGAVAPVANKPAMTSAAAPAPATPKQPVVPKTMPPVAAAPPPPPKIVAAAPAASGTVTLSLTEPVGMAAFVRNGKLWLVLDRNVADAPKVAGGLAPFKRYELHDGVAFATPLGPANRDVEIYGDGGGLAWRLTLGGPARDVQPAAMRRDFAADPAAAATASWVLPAASKIIDLPDPDSGDTVKVVTVKDAGQFAGPQTDTVDFTALRSVVGLAVAAKVDDLALTRTPTGITAARPGGLALSAQRDVSLRAMREDTMPAVPVVPVDAQTVAAPASARRIYDFDRWSLGGLEPMAANARVLLAGIATKDNDGQVQDWLSLARMNLANDRGPESEGYLDDAEELLPAIADAVEFKALRGAADALSGRYEEAAADFNAPDLKPYAELDIWRAYTLAWLEDWRQAKQVMPADIGVIFTYPKPIEAKLALKLAEVDLHAGDGKGAQVIFDTLDHDRTAYSPATAAGLDYLEGEAALLHGDAERARVLWTPLVTGPDHLYRAKAGLALTALELQNKEIKPAQAIDRLEGLRYTWRGDELEARINYMLGKIYIGDHKYLKGFGILRDAASLDPNSDIGHEITAYMKDTFKNLLMNDHTISPLDADELYVEFAELVPPGADGDVLGQKLAERLVSGDMLDRAADILQKQVDTRLQGADRAKVAMRLAAIDLLDKQPTKAMAALQVAEQLYSGGTVPASKDDLRRAELMQARAMSQENRTKDALDMLAQFPSDPDTNALRADISWQAGLWDQAASALQDMILDQIQDPNAPLTQKQADLILNRAVALNLAGNRVALANLHARYSDAMSKTSRAKLFEIVARPRESALLSDKQTLASIVSEVDIFKDFLTSYQSADIPQ